MPPSAVEIRPSASAPKDGVPRAARAAPHPLVVSIVGIDGSGKSSTFDGVLDALAGVAVAAAADYFFRTRPLAVAMPLLLNAFPFSRDWAVRSSLEHCGDLADQGWSVLVYPEGTRSPTGRLRPFRAGTGLLATELGVPVVPIGVDGCHALLPKGQRRPRRGPVTVHFGPALRPRPGETHPAAAAELADAVARLLPAEATATEAARVAP